MRRGIQRVRQGRNPVAPRPEDLGFVIPPEQTTLANGELFLRFDNGDANARILIFGATGPLRFLENADDQFMDGTFNVAPPQFAQLYTVHGLSNEHHVVGCYALLPNKQRNTNVEFLRQVQLLANGASPGTIMIDYEQACIGAIPLVFPNASAFECCFHLCKSAFRDVQAAELQEEYMVDEAFRTNI